MFTSTKLSDSPSYKKKNQKYTVTETNGLTRSILSPTITSTPLNSLAMTNRRRSLLLTPSRNRRHSASDLLLSTPKYMNSVEPTVSKLVQNANGPLLASTNCSVNLSTYVDSKSPGLASRVVQYSEERDRSLPTHNKRYGSPGVFPVVHLFKKDLPIISPKTKRVTVRIGPSDCSRYNTPEHNRLLLEGIVQNGYTSRNSQQRSEASTRSVLDALKEISRKRIHPSEEYEIDGDSVKRFRSDCFNGSSDNYKRSREDSPQSDSMAKPYKKTCYVDPFYASSTSTALEKERLKKVLSVPNDKSTQSIEVEEAEKSNDDVKLVSVETQTPLPEKKPEAKSKEDINDSDTEENKTDNKSSEDEAEKPTRKVRKAPLRIFDEKPLEIMRKNRLAILLGALTGEKPVLIPKEDKLAKFREEMEKEEEKEKKEREERGEDASPLKSILSTGEKNSEAAEKHVTFSTPTCATSMEQSTAAAETTAAPVIPVFKYSPSVTQTSTSIVSPLMSASVCDSGGSSLMSNALSTPSQATIPTISTTPASPMFAFGTEANKLTGTTTSASDASQNTLGSGLTTSNPFVAQPSVGAATTEPATSAFTFGSNSFTFGTSPAAATGVSSSSGGLQLGKPLATISGVAVTSAPVTSAFALGGSSTETNNGAPVTSAFTFGSTSFTFGTSSTAATSVGSPGGLQLGKSLVNTSTVAATSAPVTAALALGGSSTDPKIGGFKFDLSKPVSSNVANTPTMMFNSPVNKPETTKALFSTPPNLSTSQSSFMSQPNILTSVPSKGSTPAPFAFGTANKSSPFGANNQETSKPNSGGFNFMSPSNTTPAFGLTASTTTAPAFGTSSNVPLFGSAQAASTTVTPAFGTNTNNLFSPSATTTTTPGNFSFGNKSGVFTFGSNNATTTTASTPSLLGTTTTTAGSGFGTNSKPAFNFTAAPQFGTPSAQPSAAFGVPSTQASAFSFGAATSSSAPVFNAPATTTTPAFGSNTTPFGGATTTVTNGFGTVNTSTPSFGTGSTSLFGNPTGSFASSAKPMFGAGATPAFGSNTPTTTAAQFNSNATPAFAFGGSNTSANNFGASSVPAFGSTTTVGNTFGSNAAPAFGSTTTAGSTFGGTTAPAFGSTTTAGTTFGSTTAPAFGSTTTAGSTFGSSTTPAFGTSGTFGSTGPSFGSAPPFGAAATTSASGFTATATPSFGSSSGFGSGSSFGSSTGGFGSSAAPSFGAAAPTTNNNTFGSGFGSATASTPAFAAKPQTNFGSSSTNAFGTPNNNSAFGSTPQNPPPSFSANPPAQNGPFNFGAANAQSPAGGFSFGSTDIPKPSYNFTGGVTSPPTFGATPTPQFGAAAPGQFNAPTMFSIGTGSTPNRRTQLKAKRRTERP